MCAETILGEFAQGVCYQIGHCILCEPVNVETESRDFSDLEAELVYKWQYVPIFLPTCIYKGTSLF